jgi:hypothetical protein
MSGRKMTIEPRPVFIFLPDIFLLSPSDFAKALRSPSSHRARKKL